MELRRRRRQRDAPRRPRTVPHSWLGSLPQQRMGLPERQRGHAAIEDEPHDSACHHRQHEGAHAGKGACWLKAAPFWVDGLEEQQPQQALQQVDSNHRGKEQPVGGGRAGHSGLGGYVCRTADLTLC